MSDINSAIPIDNNAALLVEGLEQWIQTLLPEQVVNNENEYNAVRMMDPKTGARFAITKLREEK